MDCSWLHEEADEVDSLESEKSDVEEVERELESRLYAIVHHNDLSQPLPLELAKHYSLQHSDDGVVTVTLNHSLEQLKSEENNEIDKILESPKPLDKEVLDNEEVVIISDDGNENHSKLNHQNVKKKRFRYSDVNIDEIESKNKSNFDNLNNVQKVNQTKTSDVNRLKKANCPYSSIKIPPLFDFSKWNPSDPTDTFKPIASKLILQPKFKWKLRKALISLNPGVKMKKLFRYADILIEKNASIAKRVEGREVKNAMRNNLINGVDILKNLPVNIEGNFSVNEGITDNVLNCEKNLNKPKRFDKNGDMYLNLSPSKYMQPTTTNLMSNKTNNSKSQNKGKMYGSISLNSSPFKPNPLNVEINEDDKKNASIAISQSHLPTKWNKQMIAFYTIPSKTKMQSNIDLIFRNFNKTTKAEDWRLDPRDETGVYQRSDLIPKKMPHRRCNNCKRKGHTSQNCPEPKKTTVCFLCGGLYHTGYSCQRAVCVKCGTFSSEGECVECYYHTFQFNTSCERCGSALHRTPHCPDSWRSFHATIEGELKIPSKLTENRRKFCCNCAHWGHFSHNCPMPYHTGQQTSPFITNYSTSALEKGSTDIFLPNKYEEIITSPEADGFLQGLSDMSSTQIQMSADRKGVYLTINGTFEQCVTVRSEIEEYVNTKKRKREEPSFTKKRRRLK